MTFTDTLIRLFLILLLLPEIWAAGDPIQALRSQEVDVLGKDLSAVQGMVFDEDSNPMSNFAVWVKIPSHIPSREPLVQDMVQRGKEFHPKLLIAPVNTKVWFPNDDPIFHNVFSYNPVQRLDLGNYKGKGTPVLFDKPGVYPIGCEIHPWMSAHIVIVNTPFYGKTNSSGEVIIRDLVPGQYTFYLWADRLKKGIKTEEIVRPGLNKVTWTIGKDKLKKRRKKRRKSQSRNLQIDTDPPGYSDSNDGGYGNDIYDN